jgi:hypothetical protein
MKIRTNFVSNSSSCSFVICKNLISSSDIEKIKEWYEEQPDFIDDYGKKIEESDHYLRARIGDPSRMAKIIEQLKIPKNLIEFIET